MMADGIIPENDGKDTINELNSIIDSRNSINSDRDWFNNTLDIADLTKEFVDIMKSDAIKPKRSVLSRFGSNLIWNEEKVSIINKKWIDVLVDGLKEARSKKPQFEPKNIVDTSDSNEVFVAVRPILLRDQGSNLGHPR